MFAMLGAAGAGHAAGFTPAALQAGLRDAALFQAPSALCARPADCRLTGDRAGPAPGRATLSQAAPLQAAPLQAAPPQLAPPQLASVQLALATPDARPARLGPVVEAPEGFLSFCTRHPGDCASGADADGAQAARVAHAELSRRWLQRLSQMRAGEPTETWSSPASIAERPPEAPPEALQPAADGAAPGAARDALSLLEQVSRRINHLIRPMSDQQHYGMDGFWATPLEDDAGPAYGDCKDYALEKRRALIGAGVPAEDLALALVRTHWGELHAVLVMSTASGEYVADSLTDRILPWRQTPYAWVARQDHGQPLVWRAIVG